MVKEKDLDYQKNIVKDKVTVKRSNLSAHGAEI